MRAIEARFGRCVPWSVICVPSMGFLQGFRGPVLVERTGQSREPCSRPIVSALYN